MDKSRPIKQTIELLNRFCIKYGLPFVFVNSVFSTTGNITVYQRHKDGGVYASTMERFLDRGFTTDQTAELNVIFEYELL